MRLIQYPVFMVRALVAFFYRLLRDWCQKQWQRIRPAAVFSVGWGLVVLLLLGLLRFAPELSTAIFNLILTFALMVGVIYFCLYHLPGGGRKKNRK